MARVAHENAYSGGEAMVRGAVEPLRRDERDPDDERLSPQLAKGWDCGQRRKARCRGHGKNPIAGSRAPQHRVGTAREEDADLSVVEQRVAVLVRFHGAMDEPCPVLQPQVRPREM